MDAKTPLGKAALQHADDALRAIESKTKLKFVQFSDDDPSAVDGFIVDGGKITSFYEIKARDMSHQELRERFKSEWLLSYDKIHAAYSLTKLHRVGFTGVLYCIKDGIILVKTMWDSGGALRVSWRTEQTSTQKTVNGGRASRPNCYIDMSEAKIFSV